MSALDITPKNLGAESYKLHLRVQQRNTRKRTTTLTGLPNTYDFKTFLKDIKKKQCCSGFITDDPKIEDGFNKILQFTGDQRESIATYLIDKGIVEQKDITIHGY